jgi:16S rRNA (uracil1498-N3)-methyltransferase
MHHFYLPPEQCLEPCLRLTGREAHHGLHVLRLREGERIVVLDGAGGKMLCEVTQVKSSAIHLVVSQRDSVPPAPFQITLAQALPKGKLMDAIVQKAVELGVSRIAPLLSERVVTHLDSEKAIERAAHWRTIAIEAIKQCGSAWLPGIDELVTPQDFVARRDPFDLALIGSLQPDSRPLHECFAAFEARHGRKPRSVCVWIGPEGDFTPEEIAIAKNGGAFPVSFGNLVLRCETAAISSLAILNYELSP